MKTTTSQQEKGAERQGIAKKTIIVYGVVLAASAGVYLLFLLHSLLLQMIVAVMLAIALEPLVRVLMRRGIKRAFASTLAVFITISALLIITSLIATPLVTQGTRLLENAPQLVNDLVQNQQLTFLNDQYHLVDRVKEFSAGQASKIAGAGVSFIGVIGSILGGLSSLVIIFVLSLFLLIEGPDTWEQCLQFLRPEQTRRIRLVAKKMSQAVSGFVTGNLLISLIAGTVTLVTLLILQVPYAFALAALVAIFDLIPLVGAAIATIAVGLVALTKGLVVALIAVLVLLVYQFVEGHLIQPLVYARVISLSPLLIILASIVGAELAGIVGVLLAIPLAAVIQIAAREVFFEVMPKTEPLVGTVSVNRKEKPALR
jgi:predicted PurR-regulated permease PerM